VKLFKKIAAFACAVFAAQAASAQAPATPAAPAPAAAPAPENIWNLDLSTGGRVSIQLRPDIAPGHVERIRTLTRQGFYNGVTFHRVIEGFMAQSGDRSGTGTGGSDLPDLAAEFNDLPHLRGSVAMARTQAPDSANSQFYIMLAPRFSLDHQYTVFGRVVSGMNFVDTIERGEPPANPSRIVRASMGSDNVPPMTADELRAAAAAQAPAPASPAPAPAPAPPTRAPTGTPPPPR
jgi:cyclophilin family peptidyl-prolyl cis-trans isomerase